MSNRVLFLLPTLVLAVIALILALIGLSREPAATATPQDRTVMSSKLAKASGQPNAEGQYEYWLATKDIPAGSSLDKDSFTHIVTSDPLPKALPTSVDIDGKALTKTLDKGRFLTPSYFKTTGKLPPLLPAGYLAIAVPIDNVVAAGGLLVPGNLVDVLASFRQGAGNNTEPMAMIVLHNIEVLALGGKVRGDATDDDKSRQQNKTAVLSVPAQAATRLMLAASLGHLRLAVRSDQAVASKNEENTDKNVRDADVAKLSDLLPKQQKAAPVSHASRGPSGHRVEVYEGGKARSTYVH